MRRAQTLFIIALLTSCHVAASHQSVVVNDAQESLFYSIFRKKLPEPNTIKRWVQRGASINAPHPNGPSRETFFVAYIRTAYHTLPQNEKRKHAQRMGFYTCLKNGAYIPTDHPEYQNLAYQFETALKRSVCTSRQTPKMQEYARLLVKGTCYPHMLTPNDIAFMKRRSFTYRLMCTNHKQRNLSLPHTPSLNTTPQVTYKTIPKIRHFKGTVQHAVKRSLAESQTTDQEHVTGTHTTKKIHKDVGTDHFDEPTTLQEASRPKFLPQTDEISPMQTPPLTDNNHQDDLIHFIDTIQMLRSQNRDQATH